MFFRWIEAFTLSAGAVGMQIAFGRVRRKTAPYMSI